MNLSYGSFMINFKSSMNYDIEEDMYIRVKFEIVFNIVVGLKISLFSKY